MNDSKKNSLVKRPQVWWLPILLLLFAQQCASRLSSLEAIATDEITARRQALQALMPLTGEGQVSCDYLNGTIGASFKFYFQSIDSLHLLLSDPLGRQLARLELYGDEYEIHLLRENRLFSGSQLPNWLRQYLPQPLTTANIRNLLLGLPCNPTEENQPMRGRYIGPKTGLQTLQIPETLSIRYDNYAKIGRLALAQNIYLKLPPQKLEAHIQLTKIQTANFKLSSD